MFFGIKKGTTAEYCERDKNCFFFFLILSSDLLCDILCSCGFHLFLGRYNWFLYEVKMCVWAFFPAPFFFYTILFIFFSEHRGKTCNMFYIKITFYTVYILSLIRCIGIETCLDSYVICMWSSSPRGIRVNVKTIADNTNCGFRVSASRFPLILGLFYLAHFTLQKPIALAVLNLNFLNCFFFFFVLGTESQIVSSVMCTDVPLELCHTSTWTLWVSFG